MSGSINFLDAIMNGDEEAMHYAAYLYEQAEKYRWHDLRKNPNDLPTEKPEFLGDEKNPYYVMFENGTICTFTRYDWKTEQWLFGYGIGSEYWVNCSGVIAWKYCDTSELE